MLQVKKFPTEIIVFLRGRIDHAESLEMEEELLELMRDNTGANVIISLKDVEYISSGGLRVFVTAHKVLLSRGKKLKLCELQVGTTKLFEAAGLSQLFSIYETEREAYDAD